MNYHQYSAEEMNLEKVSSEIHQLYCKQYEKDNGKPYWTNGDYSKLDERTKEYDRNIARWHFERLAESNLRTLAWARGEIEKMKKNVRVQAYMTENGISNEYPEQRYYNLALDEAIKSLTLESL